MRGRRETTIRLGDSAKRKKRAKVVRCRQEDDRGDITERGRKIKGKYLLPPGKYIARGGRLSECRPRSVTSFPKLIPPLPHGETNTSGRRENVNSVAPAAKRKGERADSARRIVIGARVATTRPRHYYDVSDRLSEKHALLFSLTSTLTTHIPIYPRNILPHARQRKKARKRERKRASER